MKGFVRGYELVSGKLIMYEEITVRLFHVITENDNN